MLQNIEYLTGSTWHERRHTRDCMYQHRVKTYRMSMLNCINNRMDLFHNRVDFRPRRTNRFHRLERIVDQARRRSQTNKKAWLIVDCFDLMMK